MTTFVPFGLSIGCKVIYSRVDRADAQRVRFGVSRRDAFQAPRAPVVPGVRIISPNPGVERGSATARGGSDKPANGDRPPPASLVSEDLVAAVVFDGIWRPGVGPDCRNGRKARAKCSTGHCAACAVLPFGDDQSECAYRHLSRRKLKIRCARKSCGQLHIG